MGSATREATATARQALAEVSAKDALAAGTELLQAARVIGESAQMRSALADPSAEPTDKRAIVEQVFAGLGAPARGLLAAIAGSRWSGQNDLLGGIEEIGFRSIAISAAEDDISIEDELFAFGRAVASDAELELAVGSKLGLPDAKAALVTTLLGDKASPHTLAIVEQLVRQPRGRRIGELLSFAASVVADQAGFRIATITTAAPLAAAQLDTLRAGLEHQYGRAVRVNQLIDPAILGGVRVQIGDDVIDGTVATRINDLRLQLAG
jgi:F-type H+-transporting ATPase subunit delta